MMTMGDTRLCVDCGGLLSPSAAIPQLGSCVNCGRMQSLAAARTRSLKHPLDVADPGLVAAEDARRAALNAIGRREEDDLPATVAPDFSECMIGWRAWKLQVGASVVTVGGVYAVSPQVRLGSVTYSGDWGSRVAMEAACPHRHVPPDPACSCGIYSAKTCKHLQSMNYHQYFTDAYVVIGEVWLWGKVIEGTQGWRSQFAYPKRILLPFEAWRYRKALVDAYGVPVELANTLRTD